MAKERVSFRTPLARLVMGSVAIANDKDADGKPLVIKSGPNAGKPTVKWFVALAIPKAPGQSHWATQPANWNALPIEQGGDGEYWGAAIWRIGHSAFPGIANNPSFAWKVLDGDSTIPNKKGHAPNGQEGFPGHWVMMCSTSIAPKALNSTGSAEIDPKEIKRGYYVQALVTCAGNESTQNPGVYVNPTHVSLQFTGPEITSGPDVSAVGFGKGVVAPAGAGALPVFGAAPSAPPVPGAVAAPPVPGAPPAPAAPAYAAPPVPGAAPAAPMPNPAILAGVPSPAAPPPPAAPQTSIMTAKAGGQPLEAFLSLGWTLDALKANGYIA